MQVRFVRKHVGLRQVDLAMVLNMANHSVVSQWESREDQPSGMDYNTEVLFRIWMAIKAGKSALVVELLESRLKGLRAVSDKPIELVPPHAA